MDDLVTRKGLELDDLAPGDIVTVSARNSQDASYQEVLFEVEAVTAAAVLLVIRWSGGHYYKIGDKILLRRREWRFFEASDLLEVAIR